MNNKTKYLPIGTVLLLKNGQKPVMIIGYKPIFQDPKIIQNPTNNKDFDYIGCVYPEGVFRSDVTLAFSNNNISKVLYNGYETNEYKALLEKLDKEGK